MKTIAFVIITAYMLIACQQTDKQSKDKQSNNKQQKLTISVSIPPQGFIAEEITKPISNINVMVTDRQNPHNYTPKPKQMQSLTKSDIYIKLNLPHIPIENKINPLLTENNIKTINMSKNIELIYEENDHHDKENEEEHGHKNEGNIDPHIWLSTTNIKIAAKNIYDEIIKIDPNNKHIYLNNLRNFIKKVDNTKKILEETLSNMANRQFLIYHPTLAYFAKENNLKQIAIEKEGKEVSIKHLQNINRKIKLYKIKSLLTQEGFSQKNAGAIADENKLKIIKINPLKKNILENLRTIAKAIKEN